MPMDTPTSPTAILRRMPTPSKITLGHLISAMECMFWLNSHHETDELTLDVAELPGY